MSTAILSLFLFRAVKHKVNDLRCGIYAQKEVFEETLFGIAKILLEAIGKNVLKNTLKNNKAIFNQFLI